MLLKQYRRKRQVNAVSLSLDSRFNDKKIFNRPDQRKGEFLQSRTPRIYARKCEENSRFSISKAIKYSEFVEKCKNNQRKGTVRAATGKLSDGKKSGEINRINSRNSRNSTVIAPKARMVQTLAFPLREPDRVWKNRIKYKLHINKTQYNHQSRRSDKKANKGQISLAPWIDREVSEYDDLLISDLHA